MSGRWDLGFLLSDEMLPKLDLPRRLVILRCCRIAVVGNPDGWHAQVGKTACDGPEFAGVVEQALRVLKTRNDLWPELLMPAAAS
jgi:hypothetical protein